MQASLFPAYVDHRLQVFIRTELGQLCQAIPFKGMVGRWRKSLALNGDWGQLQDILVPHWKGHLGQTHVRMDGATVFESRIKHPADQKLLWDCIELVWGELLAL
ncbi:MAG: hypothetical protein K9J37_18800, partial [Saprospiraceae bacterium]|nr:hypothetical protein [Saprospiraceae bacterium]MCF8251972.1 hypothetical protein [Saprospiraceae bacterium]MCF8281693.1 hypothetical protein [Bacteroidales bacterium]MCF8313681.1 hypothetical protein [Saprospiraceae bacterium]MCF8442388.1 hypothetical protein [Saprospiraceae bacterium]